jgi:mannose-6-phosphate isomerase-like protein (cupin superfamily)
MAHTFQWRQAFHTKEADDDQEVVMKNSYQDLIHYQVPTPLSSVPFHKDVKYIERFFAEHFPLHLAIHAIQDARPSSEPYTDPHVHDVDEINIILGEQGRLEYTIQLGDEEFHVSSNASIYIPAGLSHAANVLCGSGYFIALRLPLADSTMRYGRPTSMMRNDILS